MRCTSCGTEVNGQNFCPACGNQVVRQQNPQFVPNQPQQTQPLPNYAQPQQGGNVNTVPNQYTSTPAPKQPANNGAQQFNYGQPQQSPPVQPAHQQPQNHYQPTVQGYQQQGQQNYQQPTQHVQPAQQPVQTPANNQNYGYAQPQQAQSNPYVYQQQPQQGFNQQQPQNANQGNNDINETWKVALSYIPAGFWFGLLDKSKTGRFAANQGLWALICIIASVVGINVINAILLSISYKLLFLIAILNGALALFCFAIGIFCLIGLIKAFQGETIEFPILGKNKIIK